MTKSQKPNSKTDLSNEPFVEGRDYEFDENGLMVLTAEYLLRRGYCCEKGCRHCPYGSEGG